MLSLEKCRKLLAKDSNLSDEEVIKLRDSMYDLANISIDSFLQTKSCTERGGRQFYISPVVFKVDPYDEK